MVWRRIMVSMDVGSGANSKNELDILPDSSVSGTPTSEVASPVLRKAPASASVAHHSEFRREP
jgi:hypothetical protein